MGLLATKLLLCLVLVGAGCLLIWTARAAAGGRLGRNGIAGIRTASTLASDEAWLTAHRARKQPTELGGWSSIVAGLAVLLAPTGAHAAILTRVGSVMLLAFVLTGAYRGIRAVREGPGSSE